MTMVGLPGAPARRALPTDTSDDTTFEFAGGARAPGASATGEQRRRHRRRGERADEIPALHGMPVRSVWDREGMLSTVRTPARQARSKRE